MKFVPDAATIYPPLISEYYQKLMEKYGDPIARQCLPDSAELEDLRFQDDGMNEEEQCAVPRLIHRYPNHVLLIATDRCAMRCRFCFRKRLWRQPSTDINDTELEVIHRYLEAHPNIREVLISGGDPLMLANDRLTKILNAIYEIKHIKIIRICTRIPVTDPLRVTPSIIELLSHYPTRIMTHFNHPAEITQESMMLCQQFQDSGIPVYSQTVLLKSVNDNPDTLETLFNLLAEHQIIPHYLFHIDPVSGVSHFATGLKRGHEIVAELHRRLSSIAMPVFAIDLPHGKGKINISPDTPLPNPPIFISPLTGESVTYPFQ